MGDISPSDLLSTGNKDLVSSLSDGAFGSRAGVPGIGTGSGETAVFLGPLKELMAGVWLLEPRRREALDFGHPD